ncbi:MAG: hypothetical protein Q8R55_07650 [Candidatus Taylorbacteria bacterium]|nr:hypothetical protein [Candidatus Taylorbacteria bacterium]
MPEHFNRGLAEVIELKLSPQDNLFFISVRNFLNEKSEHRPWLIKLMADRMPDVPADIDSWLAGKNFPPIDIRMRIINVFINHKCACDCK